MRELLLKAAEYIAKKRRHKTWVKVVSALACVVVFCTTYALILPAITAEKVVCGYEEHIHDEECYTKDGTLTCQLEEHTHTDECYAFMELAEEVQEEPTQEDLTQEPDASQSDETQQTDDQQGVGEETGKPQDEEAVQTDAAQEEAGKDLPEKLSGVWADDVLAVAKSQLGYRESSTDYITDDKDEEKGYTCYGDWYGDPYGDWSAMFVSFCVRYANVVNMPYAADCAEWIEVLSDEEYDLYEKAEEYRPEPGDIIFFDREHDGIPDDAGIVEEFMEASETQKAKIRTIEGDSDEAVQYVIYDAEDLSILGYGKLPEKDTEHTCGLEAHKHNRYCYGFDEKTLICAAEEHEHTGKCMPPEEEPAEKTEAAESAETPEVDAAEPQIQAEEAGTHSVTFKVLIDGEWQTVGSLPYYYTGQINGTERAYITSSMAEEFFGAYGYTADMEPGNHFGYSYDDIYQIFYSSSGTVTNYCMDVRNGTIQDLQPIQLYESNGSDAQMFRIRKAEEGYSYISPIGNSSLYINVSGGGSANGTKLALSGASDDSSRWRLVSAENNTTIFYSKNAPDSARLDLTDGNQTNGVQLQIWENAGNAYWHLSKQYRISNDTISSQNGDGTYNIGLTKESNGNIVCYYLPGESGNSISDAEESEISDRNTFWSVTVRDDGHKVYAADELSGLTRYVLNGGSIEVSVKNGEGILWSCAGKNGGSVSAEKTQLRTETQFTLKDVTQPVEVTATLANPSFTVQYYANIPRFVESGGAAELNVIDTSGGKLPQNGVDSTYKKLQLEAVGKKTSQNRGAATDLYQVMTKEELTKMYSDGQFRYETSPGLDYFNKLKENTDYVLEEIWVLKEGKSADSTNRSDWQIYPADAAFTNKADEANDKTILINDGAVIRLVSGCSTSEYVNTTTFYDYNISSGQNADGRWRTGITGINQESNYGVSSNGQRHWNSYADVFAFGNANCGTGMSGYLFDGGTLNKYNHQNSNNYGCTFGLAKGLNSDGTIQYNDWLVVPNLFNDGDASGKQTYGNSSLTFSRVGDTYTLSSATLNNTNGQKNTISELQYFFNPSPTAGTIHSHIMTNNFWPMDQAADRTDALWGAYGNTGLFQGFEESNGNWSDLASDFPPGDDGNAHNWFFGMNFALTFNLTEDYLGPLEYYFFGDDDLWVFLDGQLVCDIGGVHSSVGEYVNLRDYLPEGSSGQHTLSFFYTERGASGSTCYMSFTLPSVSGATTERDTGSLQISKALRNTGDADYSEVDYEFQVELLDREGGEPLPQTFSYTRSDQTYGTISSGGTIKLHKDENVVISGIPAGSYFRVTELTTEGYRIEVNGAEGYIASGTVENGGTKPAAFVNTLNRELPETGGTGTLLYTFSGTAMILGALVYDIIRRRKKKR